MGDETRPVKCGACGVVPWREIVDHIQSQPVDILIECQCGVRGPRIPIGSTVEAARPLAVAAWNAMWAGRAGEARSPEMTLRQVVGVLREKTPEGVDWDGFEMSSIIIGLDENMVVKWRFPLSAVNALVNAVSLGLSPPP